MWTRMSFIIILDFWCFCNKRKTSSCLLTWQPILQLFDYYSNSATTPKKQIHCHLLYFCYYQTDKIKKLWGPWISGQQNFWLLGIVQDSNIVNMSVFRAALTPCWANYPKLFGQTICQMSRALLAHKERKVEEGKTKPAVLSCIPKIPK